MIERQNPWWADPTAIDGDQYLLEIEKITYKFTPSILNNITFLPGDIHVIRGPRQVGKTTTIKLLIKKLLTDGAEPGSVIYISCEAIESFKSLQLTLLDCIKEKTGRLYLFLDEISFIDSWQRSILAVANMGLLKNATVIITGSNARDLKNSSERLPGRRGKGKDFELYPLSITEMKQLDCFKDKTPAEMLEIYMLVGGFPRAISDYVNIGSVLDSTYETYRNWIVGDAQKYELRQETLKQILFRIAETMGSRITWPLLIENSPIKSHETALHYVEHLQDAFLCTINYCYNDKQHGPAFQKARKLFFIDPLLYAIATTWRDGITNLFGYLKEKLADPSFKGLFFESVVVNHYHRKYENVYYWYSTKQHKEVDLVVNDGGKLALFEIKLSPAPSFIALGKEVAIVTPETFLMSLEM